MARRRDWRLDAALRLAGAAALGIALAVGFAAPFGRPPTSLDLLRALVAFVGTSGGAMLLVLGAHLFDEIFVSSPWLPRAPGAADITPRPPSGAG